MAGRVIWFFGPSKAGKRSLMKLLASNEGRQMTAQLGLEGEIVLCGESLDTDHREGLLEVVVEYLRAQPTLLVKGQTSDITKRRVPQALVSEIEQTVVFVWADPPELAKRCAAEATRCQQERDAEGYDYWRLQDESACTRELHEYQIPYVKSLGLQLTGAKASDGLFKVGPLPPGW